jgi:ubiquinone/menaquinone biosynthesis C-methylase UbiE
MANQLEKVLMAGPLWSCTPLDTLGSIDHIYYHVKRSKTSPKEILNFNMPFGSIFHRFDHIHATTADGGEIKFKNSIISRYAFRCIGIPHIQLRLRANKIMKNIPPNSIRMLDAGFGTGIYSFVLSDRVRNIDAVDLDRNKVDRARMLGPFSNIHFQVMNLTNLRFSDCTFDLIICSDVLEHIQDDELAFFELSRVLKRGGTLLITVPFHSESNVSAYTRFYHERSGYTASRIRDLCQKSGLIVKKEELYSYRFSNIMSNISIRILGNRIRLTIFFFIVYPLVLVSEAIPIGGHPSGIFFVIQK